VLNGVFDSRSSGDGRVMSKISLVELEHSSIMDFGGIEGERGGVVGRLGLSGMIGDDE
jgi:hypothetical protein